MSHLRNVAGEGEGGGEGGRGRDGGEGDLNISSDDERIEEAAFHLSLTAATSVRLMDCVEVILVRGKISSRKHTSLTTKTVCL